MTKPSMRQADVVHELFDLAAQEVLYRLIAVSSGKMKSDRARDMDDALAKHLARALMGENPEFEPAVGFSGLPCAEALKAVEPELYETLWKDDPDQNPDNPRILMVRCTTVFYRAVYQAISREMAKDNVTQDSVRAAIQAVVDRWALAATPVDAPKA